MVRIEFNDLKVDTISKNSGVFSGENILIRWKSVIINNEGHGMINGSGNNSYNNSSIVIESKPRVEDK